ncbi:MAG: hypothetical protein AAF830_05315 [Pseudomonadota bacterium]
MRLKVAFSLVLMSVGLCGCETVGFMTTPGILLSRDRAECRAMNDYLERNRCLAACWERQQILWEQEAIRDREARRPTTLADDPDLARAIYGG